MNMLSRDFKRSLYSSTGLADLGSRLISCTGETVSKDPNGAIVKDSLKGTLGDLVIANEREKANPVTQAIRDQVSHILKEVESIARGRKTRLQNDEPAQPAQVLNKAA
jgi:hypothetical protein